MYNVFSGNLVWRADYPSTGCFTVNGGILNGGASWYINENEKAYLMCGPHGCITLWKIYRVDFQVSGGGFNGGIVSDSIYPPLSSPGPWDWVRSNICWCGENYGTATFSSGSGTSYMGSDQKLVSEAPPIWIGTAENSNMNYGCFQNSGTTLISQAYGLSGHC